MSENSEWFVFETKPIKSSLNYGDFFLTKKIYSFIRFCPHAFFQYHFVLLKYANITKFSKARENLNYCRMLFEFVSMKSSS